MISNTTLEALAGITIVAGKLQESLAFGGVTGSDTRLLPAADNGVVLGRQLLQQTDSLVLILLLTEFRSIDEQQGDPRIDNKQVGLHTTYPFRPAIVSELVKLVMIIPIGGGLTGKQLLQLLDIGHLQQIGKQIGNTRKKVGKLTNAYRGETGRPESIILPKKSVYRRQLRC